MFKWLKTFLARHLVQDVPIDLARCEFGCKKTECSQDEWETCKNRINDVDREAAYAQATLHTESPSKTPLGD